jgi:hypothetical protein
MLGVITYRESSSQKRIGKMGEGTDSHITLSFKNFGTTNVNNHKILQNLLRCVHLTSVLHSTFSTLEVEFLSCSSQKTHNSRFPYSLNPLLNYPTS